MAGEKLEFRLAIDARELEAALDKLGATLEKIAQNGENAFKRLAETARAQLDQLNKSLAARGDTAKELTSMASAIAKLQKSLAGLQSVTEGTAKSSSAFLQFADSIKKSLSMTELFKASLVTFGVGFGAYGIAQTIRRATEAIAEFDLAMREVWTLTDATKNRFDELTEAVVDLSRKIPISTSDLAKGMYWAISAGIELENALDFIEVAAKAAIGGLTDMKTAVDVLTTALNAYGYSASEAARITDALFQAMRLSKTTFEELASSIGPIFPVASQLGVSIEEVAAALATLANMGISTARAATYVNQALVRILSPTQEAKRTAAELGIQFSSTALQAMGFVNYLRYLKETVGDNEEAMANLFENVRAMRAIFALTSEEGYRQFVRMLEAVKNSAGATEEAAKKMTNSLANEWQRLKNIWSAFLKDPALRDALASFVGALANISEKITGVTSEADRALRYYSSRVALVVSEISSAVTKLSEISSGIEAYQKLLTDTQYSMVKYYDNLTQALKTFDDVLVTSYLNKYGYIDLTSQEEKLITTLEKNYPALARAIQKVGDAYSFNKEVLLEYLKTQVESIKASVAAIEVARQEYLLKYERYKQDREIYRQQLESIQKYNAQTEEALKLYSGALTILENLRADFVRKIASTLGLSEEISAEELVKKMEWRLYTPSQLRAIKSAVEQTLKTSFDEITKMLFDAATKAGAKEVANAVAEFRKALSRTENPFFVLGEFLKLLNVLSKMKLPETIEGTVKVLKIAEKDLGRLMLVGEYPALATGVIRIWTKLAEVLSQESESLKSENERLNSEAARLRNQLENLDRVTASHTKLDEQYNKVVAQLNAYISNLEKEINNISRMTPQQYILNATFRRLNERLEVLKLQERNFLRQLERDFSASFGSLAEISTDVLLSLEGFNLEEFHKKYSASFKTLQGTIDDIKNYIYALRGEDLAEEQRRFLDELEKLVLQYEAIVNSLAEIDASDIINKVTARDVRDLNRRLQIINQELKKYGINLQKLVESLPVVSTLEEAGDELEAALKQELLKTKRFGSDTAARIASEIANVFIKYASSISKSYLDSFEEEIAKLKDLPYSERLSKIFELQKSSEEKSEELGRTLARYVGNYAGAIVMKTNEQVGMLISRALADAIMEMVERGFSVQEFLDIQTINAIVALYRAKYEEGVEHFRRRIEQKYREVFGEVPESVSAALEALAKKTPTDRQLATWFEDLERLRNYLLSIARVLRLLGAEMEFENALFVDFLAYGREGVRLVERYTRLLDELAFRFEWFNTVFGGKQLADLTKIEALREYIETFLGEVVSPFTTRLRDLSYELKTGAITFEDVTQQLEGFGVTTAEELGALVSKVVDFRVQLEGTRNAANRAASTYINLLETLLELKKAYEELSKLTVEDLLRGGASDLESLQRRYAALSDNFTQLRLAIEKIEEIIANFEASLAGLPEVVRGRFEGVVEALKEAGSGIKEQYNQMLSDFEETQRNIAEKLSQAQQELAKLLERALATTTLQEAVELYNKLFEIDVPSGWTVNGKPVRVAIREATIKLQNIIEGEFEALERRLEKISRGLNFYKFLSFFYKTGDLSAASREIEEIFKAITVEPLRKAIESIEDPQLKNSFLERLSRLEEALEEAKVRAKRELISRATRLDFFEMIFGRTPTETEQELYLKAIREFVETQAEELEGALDILGDLSRQIVRAQERNREKLFREAISNLRAYYEGLFEELEKLKDRAEIETKKASILDLLLADQERLLREYPEFVSETINEIINLVKRLEATSLEAVANLLESSMNTIARNLRKLRNELSLETLDNYVALLKEAKAGVEAIAEGLETIKGTKAFDRLVERLESLREEIAEYETIDLGRLFKADNLIEAIEQFDLLLLKAKELEKAGFKVIGLETLPDQLMRVLREVVMGGLDLARLFEENILMPMVEAFAQRWREAWQEMAEEGVDKASSLQRAWASLAEAARQDIASFTKLAAFSLISLSRNIFRTLERLGAIKEGTASVVEAGIEGLKGGAFIGSFLGPIGTLIGGILGFAIGAMFESAAQAQRRAREELERQQRALESLAASLGRGIESAFAEADVEAFANRVRTSLYEAVRDALIEALIAQTVAERVKELAAMIQANAPIEQIQGQIEVIVEQLRPIYEHIRQLFPQLYEVGLELSATSAVRSITEETANRLVALFTTMNLNVAAIRRVLEEGVVRVLVVDSVRAEAVLRSMG
ncbi:MAG: phage tail tape measure protein [Thermofilaceae archaeon]